MPRQAIFIMTDTQGTDYVGCYGETAITTPNIDRLAAQGTRFDRAYTCQPVCGPARSALFTGTFPHSNGSWGNTMALGDNMLTVGQRLRDAGIRCGYIGKWHLDAGDYFGKGRCADGWDPECWYDMRNYLDELLPEMRKKSRQASFIEEDPPADITFGHRCIDRARRFVEQHRDEDFLLVVSLDEPHGPYICPKHFADQYRGYKQPQRGRYSDTLEGKPFHHQVWAGKNRVKPGEERQVGHPYLSACTSFIDEEIGRLITTIDETIPDSLVFFTSDHGDFGRSRGLSGKGPAAYDDIARIPFIVRWPGTVPAGTVSPAPTSHIDVVPTLIDYFQAPASPLLEGRSMLPALADPSTATNQEIFIEYSRYEIDHDGFGGFQPLRAIMDGRYKLTINLLDIDELYDLETDSEELHNRIEDPELIEIRNRLHDRLLRWMDDTRDPFRSWHWERRPWRSDAPPAHWDNHGMTRQRVDLEKYEPGQLDYDTGLPMTDPVRRKG
ncbi:MAG: sulfatase-like hydrolase/transferase [Planctomycetota bacterium]|jgi:uncharacterized sulfatase|nr:sulfatase-like hydrolase/transferase [Planctomycetota bacterium]